MSYFNKDIETLPLEKLRKLQNERLQIQIQNVYTKVPYYKQQLDEKGLKPSDIKTALLRE